MNGIVNDELNESPYESLVLIIESCGAMCPGDSVAIHSSVPLKEAEDAAR